MLIFRVLSNRTFNRKLLFLALPITMQSLMLALVAAADALMLGRLDQASMAAVSLATQIQFVQNMLLGAIATGIGILGAQYWGKQDKNALEDIFGTGVRESLVISLCFWSGCYFYPEKLMRLFAGDPNLIGIGSEYLRVASWSYLITGVSQCYLAMMRVSEHASRSAWISSGAVVINIILNAVFIFGLAGAPAMGVRGAALATVIARVIELVWCIVSTFENSFIRLKMRALFTFNKVLELDFWRYALPVLGSYLLWGVGFTSYTAIMGHMGEDAAAANGVAAVVRDLICCLCNGVSGASCIMIGNELGSGKLLRGKMYGERCMILSYMIGLLATVVVLASLPFIKHMIKLTPAASEYMAGMFVILSVYMIGRCVNTVVENGVFSAGGDTLFDTYSLAVCMWGVALPCAFLGAFYFRWPVLVVFACTCLDEVGKIPWVMYHYKKYKWVKNITRD